MLAVLDPGEPGCAAAVGIDDDIVWEGAVGLAVLDPPKPIDATTIFDIASTSKQFTATAVLLLVEEGLLDLDDSLSSVVAGLPAWAETTTLAHLLHHQSGIPDYTDLLEQDYDERTTAEDALATLRQVEELDFDPGSAFEYSNSGYFLLSLVVESVSGDPLPELLDEQVFTPLGLDAVMDPVPDLDGRAASYASEGDGFVTADSRWEQTGDGGVQTTPRELVRWAREYWEPTLGGEDLLSGRTAGAVDDGDGARYGAGIVISEDEDGRTVLSHAGSWAGFVSDLMIMPEERIAVAVTCNLDEHDPTEMAGELLDLWAGP